MKVKVLLNHVMEEPLKGVFMVGGGGGLVYVYNSFSSDILTLDIAQVVIERRMEKQIVV